MLTISPFPQNHEKIPIFTSLRPEEKERVTSYFHKLWNLGLFINITTSRQDVFLEQIAHKIFSCFQKF